MKIFIAGGTGFIGQALIDTLLEAGHQVCVLARNPGKLGRYPGRLEVVQGSPLLPGRWQDHLADQDLLINLTGSSIFTRWTEAAKEQIRRSRLLATKTLVNAITTLSKPGPRLINASAAGYYGFGRDEEKTENSPAGDDFLARVCAEWEAEAVKAGAQTVLLRTGIVLGSEGGALAAMLPTFRLGLGGRLGTGEQWFPWIHRDDLTRAILFLVEHPEISGPINLSAPNPVRNRELTRALGRTLHRPAILPVPATLIRLLLGEMSSLLLEGCRMVPTRLSQQGFHFTFSELEPALFDLRNCPAAPHLRCHRPARVHHKHTSQTSS